MKRLVLTLLLVLTATSASAAPVAFSGWFTADNRVTGISLFNKTDSVTMTFAGKSTDWWTPAAFSTTLELGKEYVLSFTVKNDGAYGSGNPAGFLGDFTMGGVSYLTQASPVWSVDSGSLAQFHTNNEGLTSIWYRGNGNKTIANISGDAWWIGKAGALANNESYTVSANFTATPIPAAVWLLGSGVLALVGLRRRFR